MYIATIFNEELGDITEVQPAESFDDAVAFVFESIGQKNGRTVEVTRAGRYFGLTVSRGDTVIATVEDREPAERVSAHAQAEKLMAACNALEDSDTKLLESLFTSGGTHGEGKQTQTMTGLNVSLDDGLSWQSSGGIRVMFHDANETDDGMEDLLVNITTEGIVLDLSDQESGEASQTASILVEDLVRMTC